MLSVLLLLGGCTGRDVVMATGTPLHVADDPQICLTHTDCTTKTSRTLLFIFDYAAAGGALLQRQERLLFTPLEAPVNDWPALQIHLAEPMDSRFEFAAECRVAHCRYDTEQLLRVYRSYLTDRPCSLLLDSAVRACSEQHAVPLAP